MPIMLATYSTNKIIVLKRYVSERKKNINQTNTRTQTNSPLVWVNTEQKRLVRKVGQFIPILPVFH